MADQKLSQLTALANADLATDDLLLVTDTDAVASKSILVSELDLRYKNYLTAVSKSTTYTALASDDLIVCTTSGGAFTVTLPAAADNANKLLIVKKIATATDFNQVTIDGNASETIDGSASIKLTGAGESVRLQCDGTGWNIISWTASKTMTFVPTITNCDNIDANTSRLVFADGYCFMDGQFTLNGAGTTAAATTLSLPFTIDTADLAGGTNTANGTASTLGGNSQWFESGVQWRFASPQYASTTTFGFAIATQLLFGSILSSGDGINYNLRIPVA